MGRCREKNSLRCEEPPTLSMKVWFSEGDAQGWAIDEDLRLLREALGGQVTEASLATANSVVAVWWWKLLRIPPRKLSHRYVIALADNPPFRYIRHPSFIQGVELVDLWVGRSSESVRQFEALGLPVVYAPYAVDLNLFRPLEDRVALRESFLNEHSIPHDRYLIGNFHRDTEGGPAGGPKIQKAPEVFLKLAVGLRERGVPVHVVLAGPRRHWLRRALGDAAVPFTFVGDPSLEGDDYPANILERSKLNQLYNAIDLYCITSRWEGGPHSVLEAGAAGCPVISTPVGVAADLLPPARLFNSLKDGISKSQSLIARGDAARADAAEIIKIVRAKHSPSVLGSALCRLMSVPSGLDHRIKSKRIRWHSRPDLPGLVPGLRRFLMRRAIRERFHLKPLDQERAFAEELFSWIRNNALSYGQTMAAEHATPVVVAIERDRLLVVNRNTGRKVEVLYGFRDFLNVASRERISEGTIFADTFRMGGPHIDSESPIVTESLSGPEPVDILGQAVFQAVAMLQQERAQETSHNG